MAYKSLTKEQQARLDPMITGFNPTDMYAADHIRRVLETFPGVFTGIGEFTIHKEFVSAKISGQVASLEDPALDRLLDFAAEVGLVVLIHNDIDVPFAKEATEPAYLSQIKGLFARHPNATIIWAHMGLGRTVHPSKNHFARIEDLLRDPAFNNVYFDISWDEVAKNPRSHPGSHADHGRSVATLPQPLSVWDRRGRPGKRVSIHKGFPTIRAFVAFARCGYLSQSSAAELRTNF
jgi:hypothetical protein